MSAESVVDDPVKKKPLAKGAAAAAAAASAGAAAAAAAGPPAKPTAMPRFVVFEDDNLVSCIYAFFLIFMFLIPILNKFAF